MIEVLASRVPESERSSETGLRLAVSLDKAACAIGISRDSFERHVLAEIRVVRIGRRVVVPVRELERWVERHASRSLADELERLQR